MAAITKSGVPSLATQTPANEHQLPGIAGEAIAAGDTVYIFGEDTASGLPIFKKALASNGMYGVAQYAAVLNGPIAVIRNVWVRYATGLTPTALVYQSGTVAGGIQTTAANAANAPCGKVITSTMIEFFRTLPGANS